MGITSVAMLYYGFDLPEDEADRFDDEFATGELDTLGEPIDVQTGCHRTYNSPVRFVCVKSISVYAFQGRPEHVDVGKLASLADYSKHNLALRTFCDATGITYREPGWRLATLMG